MNLSGHSYLKKSNKQKEKNFFYSINVFFRAYLFSIAWYNEQWNQKSEANAFKWR